MDVIVDPSSIDEEQRRGQLSLRALAVGAAIGSLLCASNTFFGLQTGWVTMASLQAALLAYGVFRVLGCSKRLTMLENVVAQTTSVAASALPLTAGLAGLVPSLQMQENGPPPLNIGQLMVWALGLSVFGIFLAIPLRTTMVIRQKLRFPSGTATAELIAVLHGSVKQEPDSASDAGASGVHDLSVEDGPGKEKPDEAEDEAAEAALWRARWQALGYSVLAAAVVTILMEFVPVVRSLPVMRLFGWTLLTSIGWTITPSLSYVGQGMIMGLHTTLSMLLGSVVGWIGLALLARESGLAPGPVSDPETGVKAWVTWCSLGIMLGDAAVTLTRSILSFCRHRFSASGDHAAALRLSSPGSGYDDGASASHSDAEAPSSEDTVSLIARSPEDAPDRHSDGVPEDPAAARGETVPLWLQLSGGGFACCLCVAVLCILYGTPWYEPIVALLLSGIVAVVATRALGETDLNPVSGVGKLSQLVFAVVAPGNVTSNLVAGAVAEAGAQQAGELLQDLKVGHLVGASPMALLVGQLVGTGVGVVVSVLTYSLLTSAYVLGGPELPVPTARVWLDMALLVNGGRLPRGVLVAALVCFVVGAAISAARSDAAASAPWVIPKRWSKPVLRWAPSAMAMGIGMYIAPNWVLPRVAGGVAAFVWERRSKLTHGRFMLLVASGFVLGEGLFSIINALARTAGAKPWTCAGCYGALECSGC